MHNELLTVNFDNDELILINHDGKPYVAMKPIVTNLGLAWQSQLAKLREKFASTATDIVTVGADNKSRLMTCLPLRKIYAYLNSISPNKVSPELKEKVIRYQEECDDVLADYWEKGFAGKPQLQKAITPYELNSVQKNMDRILGRMRNEKSPEIWNILYIQFKQCCEVIGIDRQAVTAMVALQPAEQGQLL